MTSTSHMLKLRATTQPSVIRGAIDLQLMHLSSPLAWMESCSSRTYLICLLYKNHILLLSF